MSLHLCGFTYTEIADAALRSFYFQLIEIKR